MEQDLGSLVEEAGSIMVDVKLEWCMHKIIINLIVNYGTSNFI